MERLWHVDSSSVWSRRRSVSYLCLHDICTWLNIDAVAGVLFYLSKWYSKSELNLRMAIFYSGSLLSGAFGSLIAAGILSGLDGAMGMSSWRWLYIIEGSITCFVSFDLIIPLK